MVLPITPDAWRRAFARFVEDKTRAWKYLEAASCTLQIEGDSLGTCELSFDHDASPLRWALGSWRRKAFVRLVDDSGQHDTVPDILFYSMERPLEGVRLDAETARKDWTVPPPGGLLLARHPPFADAAVVSAPPTGGSLQDLGVQPDVDVRGGAPALLEAFRLLCLWHGARQAGFLVHIRQRQVTGSVIDAILTTMCGKNWARVEQAFAEKPVSRYAREALESCVDRHTRFGRRLSQQTDARHSEAAIAANFVAEAGRQGVSQDRDLCHFALRLACHQADVLSDPLLESRIRQLADNPALLRGARLVSLVRHHHRERPPAGPRSKMRT